jgi:hypothetical protein
MIKYFVLILFISVNLHSQNFKEVNNAQDVIDNHIAAIGGRDALDKIESVKMKGIIGEGESSGSLDIYFSDRYLYMDMNMMIFAFKMAYDKQKNKGWRKFGNKVDDLSKDELEANKRNTEGSMWKFYLNPSAYGITFEMLQNELIDSTDCYVIEVKKDNDVYSTEYFNRENFFKLREIKGGMVTDYSDYRRIENSDIIMPFNIKSQAGDVKLTEIKFNTKIDKNLLKKPKE